MPDKSNNANSNSQNPGSAGYGMSPDVQSSYDADEFLYNSVPYGDYPEVTPESIHENEPSNLPKA